MQKYWDISKQNLCIWEEQNSHGFVFFPKSSKFSSQHFPVIYKLTADINPILDSILTLQMNVSYHAQKLCLLKAIKVAGIIFQVLTVFQLCKVLTIRHKVWL